MTAQGVDNRLIILSVARLMILAGNDSSDATEVDLLAPEICDQKANL